MAWFKLAGEGAFHAKVLVAGNEAYGAWCRAGQWSSQHLTEGRIPRAVALTIASEGVWARLVTATGGCAHGLVEASADGWVIHDFLDWNPSAAEELAKREADRVRKANGRKSQGRGADGRVTSSRSPGRLPADSPRSPPVPYPYPISDQRSDPPLPPKGGEDEADHDVPDSAANGPPTAVSGQQPLIPDVAKGAAAEAARVSELWAFYLDFWKRQIGRPPAPDLNRERKRAIVKGLKAHGPEKSRDLIRGLWLSPLHAEDGYHDIIYAFRSTNEGRFLLLARGGGAGVGAAPINGTSQLGPGVVHENLRHVRPPPS